MTGTPRPDDAQRDGITAAAREDSDRRRERAGRISDSPGIADGLREHVERSPLAIAVVNAATHVVRYANPAFRRLNRADPSVVPAIVGSEVERSLPAVLARQMPDLLDGVSDRGPRDSEVEVEEQAADGSVTAWSVSAWPVAGNSGQTRDIVVEIRDRSEAARDRRTRIALLEELRQVNERLLLSALDEQELRDEAQAASEAKSKFMAMISHELRTPLNAIMGFEQLLAAGITGPVNDAQRAQLQRIHASSQHLLALIDEILDLARLDAGKAIVQHVPVDVAGLISDVISFVSGLAAEKRLSLTVLGCDEPITIASDALKLRQILVNLLGNAVKFTDDGGITVRAGLQNDRLTVAIEDTGIGIAAADLPRIFDAFWQVDQTSARRREGSGLGLSVSRQYARLLGGDLMVESTENAGSCFTLWLPVGSAGAVEQDG